MKKKLVKRKTSQTQAGYMIPKNRELLNKKTGLFCCGNCDNFISPHGCQGVSGKIFKGGCCNFYQSDRAKKP